MPAHPRQTAPYGVSSSRERERSITMVFVLDRHKKPLMPCTPKRARLLLAHGRAVVHRVSPFVIRLRDRRVEDCALQPLALKIDPGSRTSGMTLARVQETEEGEVHTAVLLAEVSHRGEAVHRAKQQEANARRRRRSANLRHRAPRFLNRGSERGWLPPSLRSRVGNVVSWTARFSRWAPLTRIEVESVRFDTQLLQHPEIEGVAYQSGTLAGWEVRAYLLSKYAYRCAYCGKTDTPFQLDHIRPRSRGGSHRVSNLCLSCQECNQAKGDKTAAEWGHAEVEHQAQAPLKDAAAVNATRYKLVEALRVFGVPTLTWSGGRTRWNRARFGIEKTHALDALCVGELAGVWAGRLKTLTIIAKGRGEHCRTNWDRYGFPRGYLMRHKQVRGFKTGDRIRAVVPAPLKSAGMHIGRVQVRQRGSFDIQTHEWRVEGVNVKYCRLVQRADGYEYAIA
jgi:5-methylcytosine-specific restriction endonuclease McrA